MAWIAFNPSGTWGCWDSHSECHCPVSLSLALITGRKISDSHRHQEPQFTPHPTELPAKCVLIPPEHCAGGKS